MSKIAIVYSSGRGHTRIVAEHVQIGAESYSDTAVDLIEITAGQLNNAGRWRDDDIMRRLGEADAIVFGTPTYMGSSHGLYKLFLEDGFRPWLNQEWKDKIAAGFTNSSSKSGDKLITLQQLSIFAMQMGMLWVGVGDPPGGNFSDTSYLDVNGSGSWLGFMSQSFPDGTDETSPHPGDRLSAERFGKRVARVTARWMVAAKQFPVNYISEHEARRRNIGGLDEWRKFDD